jgi:quinoprotein glucose dehydrogenase
VLTLDTGKTVTGIIIEEANGVLRLVDDQADEFTVSADAIEDRYQGQSAMPDDVARHLTRREIRDLVEYLASLKE